MTEITVEHEGVPLKLLHSPRCFENHLGPRTYTAEAVDDKGNLFLVKWPGLMQMTPDGAVATPANWGLYFVSPLTKVTQRKKDEC
jgi:hypothetical protein